MDWVTGNAAALVGIYAALGYDIIAATCSSPQTTEINASSRAETLMKWVYLGVIQAALFAGIGIAIEVKSKRPWWPPALGTGLAAGLLWMQYAHAKQAGLKDSRPGTESY